jgi:LacI family transcriptional regulator
MSRRVEKVEDLGGKPGEKAARLIEVANLANVSRATAARALGGYGRVNEDTRRRVTVAASALNYRTNEVARAMRHGRTSTIGVVIADISNSFFNSAIRAIIDTAAHVGYQVLVINTDDEVEREIEAVRVLTEKRVDGLIVAPSSPARYQHLAADHLALPLVLLDRRIPGLPVDTVTTDDRRGAIEAIDLLIARGHTKIGLLVASAAVRNYSRNQPEFVVSTTQDRVAGARFAMARSGLALRDAWVRYSEGNVTSATEAAVSILGQKSRPTAVLTTNEEMACGLLAACRQLNLLIGKDVSLISFDDWPWASVFAPAISVVKRPIYDLGKAAVTQLVLQIKTGATGKPIELPSRLIDRESVLDVKGKK